MASAPRDMKLLLDSESVMFVSWRAMRGILKWTNEAKDGTIMNKVIFEKIIEILSNGNCVSECFYNNFTLNSFNIFRFILACSMLNKGNMLAQINELIAVPRHENFKVRNELLHH